MNEIEREREVNERERREREVNEIERERQTDGQTERERERERERDGWMDGPTDRRKKGRHRQQVIDYLHLVVSWHKCCSPA